MLQRDIGKLFGHLGHHPAPELGNLQHVGFVDTGQFLAAFAGQGESHVGDALDFGAGVSHGVHSALLGPGAGNAARCSIIETPCQFADNNHVDPFDQMIFKGGRIQQGSVGADRPQVGIDAQGFADAQQAFFRTLFRGGIIKFRQTDRAHQSGVRFQGQLFRFRWKRRPRLMDRDAAEQAFAMTEFVPEFGSHPFQDAHRLAGHFHSDSIPRQN